MTWTQLQLSQLAREAGEQAVRAAMAGGSGSSQRASGGSRPPSLGRKQGIPNWNCRCGAKANFGTRPTCRDCGAEAPKRILNLQAAKASQGGGQPNATPPNTPRASSTPTPGTPILRPSTPRQTGLNTPNEAAQSGAWGTINGSRKVHWAGDPPPEQTTDTPADPAELRKELAGLRQTLQTAKNSGTPEDVLQLLENKISQVQAKLDATRPKDAQLQSLLDKKKGLTAKTAAAETRISKAKEELAAAEAEQTSLQEQLAQVEAKLEAAFQEQRKTATPTVDPKAEDNLILKAFSEETPPDERASLLKALEALHYNPVQAQERYYLLNPPPAPPQPAVGSPEAEAAEAEAKVKRLEKSLAKGKAEADAKKAALKAAEEAKLAEAKAKEAQQAADGKPDDSPEKVRAREAATAAADSEAKRARTAKLAEQAAREAEAAAAMEIDESAQEAPDA